MTPQVEARLKEILTEAVSLLGRPEPDPPQQTLRRLAWGVKVSQVFRDRVWWIADELTRVQGKLFDANYLMAAMAFETGERFTANVKNPASTATGLIQFMEFTAKALGTTTRELAAMTAEDQLNYVYKYFLDAIKAHGPITSLEDTYMAILWPSAIGKPSEYPLFKNDRNKARDSYDVNAGLDKDKNQVVTKAEAAAKVMEKLVKGLLPENAA